MSLFMLSCYFHVFSKSLNFINKIPCAIIKFVTLYFMQILRLEDIRLLHFHIIYPNAMHVLNSYKIVNIL